MLSKEELEENMNNAVIKMDSCTWVYRQGLKKAFNDYYTKQGVENRDAAFMKDLYESTYYLKVITDEYVSGHLHSKYMLEKLRAGQRMWDAAISYFEIRDKEGK